MPLFAHKGLCRRGIFILRSGACDPVPHLRNTPRNFANKGEFMSGSMRTMPQYFFCIISPDIALPYLHNSFAMLSGETVITPGSITCFYCKCKYLKINEITPYLLSLFLSQTTGYQRIPWHCIHCGRGGKDTAPTEDNRKGTEMNNRLETAIKASAAEARLTKQKVLKELKQQMEGLIQQIGNDRLWISDLKELHNQVAEAVAKVTAADEKIKTEELFKAFQ